MVLMLVSCGCFFLGLVMLAHQVKHLMSALVCLEIMMFGALLSVFFAMSVVFDSLFSLIVLTLVVCESAIGLGLLVLICRMHGNDYMGNFNSHF